MAGILGTLLVPAFYTIVQHSTDFMMQKFPSLIKITVKKKKSDDYNEEGLHQDDNINRDFEDHYEK